MIPLDFAQGSWDRDGFLTYKMNGYQRKFVLGMKGVFKSDETKAVVLLNGVMAEIYELPYAIGDHIGYIAVPINSGDIKKKKSEGLSLRSDKVEGSNLSLVSAKDEEGTKWLWLK